MNHHQAFLQDILEHPNDDAPRLIHADWLEEHGDPIGPSSSGCSVRWPRWRG
jgi:uncharacterized protein (TIGR02996 family)